MSITADFAERDLPDFGYDSLTDILEIQSDSGNDTEEPVLLTHSPYYDNEKLINTLKEKLNSFKIYSINCQSLNAKLDELKVYIEMLNIEGCKFDALCLQEVWLDGDINTSVYKIDGYNFILKGRNKSRHGGLAIYLDEKYNYQLLQSRIPILGEWEEQFIEVETCKAKLVIGNIYRLPRETQTDHKTFFDEFSELISVYQHQRYEVILVGDFNIDLLKINTKEVSSQFFELVSSHGYIPKLTLPTRFSSTSGTLIDNVFCKLSQSFSKTTAGILLQKLSDHQPYFITLDYLSSKTTRTKYVKVKRFDERSLINFKQELSSSDILNKLDKSESADPNLNYAIFESIILSARNKHIQSKTVKYNKHRHKQNKWITKGILNSIRFRDKLYKRLKTTSNNNPIFYTLKNNLQVYNRILKKNIRSAKYMYYNDCFDKYKNDIKKTWQTIKEIINTKSKDKASPEFVKFDDCNYKIPNR